MGILCWNNSLGPGIQSPVPAAGWALSPQSPAGPSRSRSRLLGLERSFSPGADRLWLGRALTILDALWRERSRSASGH